MDNPESARDLKEILGTRLRSLRNGRGWSANELAARLRPPFRPDRTTKGGIGYKLEQGRREINDVLLLFALAEALNVSPIVLLLPTDGDELINLIPGRPPVRARDAYAWIIGAAALPSADGSADPDGDQPYLVQRAALHKELPYINDITARVADIDVSSKAIYQLIQQTNRKEDQ